MADADKDEITKTVISSLSQLLPVVVKPSKAEIAAKIERERLDSEHRRNQDAKILRAAVWFTTSVSVVCVVAVFSPWSTDQTRSWATATLTAVATSFGGYWAGKQSIK